MLEKEHNYKRGSFCDLSMQDSWRTLRSPVIVINKRNQVCHMGIVDRCTEAHGRSFILTRYLSNLDTTENLYFILGNDLPSSDCRGFFLYLIRLRSSHVNVFSCLFSYSLKEWVVKGSGLPTNASF